MQVLLDGTHRCRRHWPRRHSGGSPSWPVGLAVIAAVSATSCSSSEEGIGVLPTETADASTDALSDAPPYTILAFDKVRIGSDSSQPNFQETTAGIDLHSGPFASVRLVVDLDTTCFPFESWQDNPPPPGENWPADCDAFDRNFEVSLDKPIAPDSDPPGIELVRAITPFGGPMQLDVDVTDVANGRRGQHTLTAYISTFSDPAGQVSGSNGGWTISARLEVTPGMPPRNVLAVTPLFYDYVDQPGTDPLSFVTPGGTVHTRLEYRATGHGGVSFGCGIQTAEEFCLRTHTLLVDANAIADLQPWRDDCASLCTQTHYGSAAAGFHYCAENPCGALDSVRASRANWCPGSVTPPFIWEPETLSAGIHDFRWQISEVADGGSWRLSALLLAFAD
jgi:hypothetical protein